VAQGQAVVAPVEEVERAGEPEQAVVAQGQAVVAPVAEAEQAEELEQAVVAQGQAAAAPVSEVVLVAAVDLESAEGQESAEESELQVRKARRSENGGRRRQCCTPVRPEELTVCREQVQEQERAAYTPSRKKTFARCWDCSPNWANRGKILNTAWTCRRFNRA